MGKDYPVTDTFLTVNGGNQRWLLPPATLNIEY